jgi:hypothetical protein
VYLISKVINYRYTAFSKSGLEIEYTKYSIFTTFSGEALTFPPSNGKGPLLC